MLHQVSFAKNTHNLSVSFPYLIGSFVQLINKIANRFVLRVNKLVTNLRREKKAGREK